MMVSVQGIKGQIGENGEIGIMGRGGAPGADVRESNKHKCNLCMYKI